MEDVNSDKMIDSLQWQAACNRYATALLKTQLCDVIVCSKACLLFYYTLKSVYFFFTKP